ncbi:MAG: UDP-N-acetylglucosamine 1-carboxyvinyltransferase [Lentisphaeria bacterium]|nr:UDP-N-acetylglucosamine 1-carboxyvinyltransferase [Lentisphaeria bacterium]
MTGKDCFAIEGGKIVNGEITASGNKNAILPILAACLLTDDTITLKNVPKIVDVGVMLDLLTFMGAEVEREGGSVQICCKNVTQFDLPEEQCRRIRTSFLFVAPLLHRLGKVRVGMPGGDGIGRRRLDAHIYGLTSLGATLSDHEMFFEAKNGLTGRDLFFDEASVTATEHILMAAVLAKGITKIRNAASEPHVQDLAHFLVAMGADIDGINTNTLTVRGVDYLRGCEHKVVSDHIEVGSFLALAASTQGEITIHGTDRTHYWMINRVFERFGIELKFTKDSVFLPGGQIPQIINDVGGAIPRVDDGPWPQFPSDLMSAMLVLATQTQGTVMFFEKMFESRLYFVDPLIQMGASIIVCDPHRVVISGKSQLHGLPLRSPDIRAGMALLMAAICAKGKSTVQNAHIIDRGYENIEEKLHQLGIHIDRL